MFRFVHLNEIDARQPTAKCGIDLPIRRWALASIDVICDNLNL